MPSVYKGPLCSFRWKHEVVGVVWKLNMVERCVWVMSSQRSDLCWLLTVSQHQAHSILFCDAVAGLLKTTLPRLPPAGVLLRSAGQQRPAEGDWKVRRDFLCPPALASSSRHLNPAQTIFAPTFLEVPALAAQNPTLSHTHQKPKSWSHGAPPSRYLASFQDDPQCILLVLVFMALHGPLPH